MKAFKIDVPKGTKLYDVKRQRIEENGASIHAVASSIERAHDYITTVYAHTIGEDAVTRFNNMPANAASEDLAYAIDLASLISGSIEIEGAVLIESEGMDYELFVRASEGDKVRWVRLSGETTDISPWDIVETLQDIF